MIDQCGIIMTGGWKMTIQETKPQRLRVPSFDNMEAFKLIKAKEEIALPVTREDMVSVGNGLPSSYQMVLLHIESGSGIMNANRHIDHAFSVIAERKSKGKQNEKKHT